MEEENNNAENNDERDESQQNDPVEDMDALIKETETDNPENRELSGQRKSTRERHPVEKLTHPMTTRSGWKN